MDYGFEKGVLELWYRSWSKHGWRFMFGTFGGLMKVGRFSSAWEAQAGLRIENALGITH